MCIDIENAFHALALDEHRAGVNPTLWFLPSSENKTFKTNLKQCWFPGVHNDIGGSYEDARPRDFSDLALAWMFDQCRGLLAFNDFSEIPGLLGTTNAFDSSPYRSLWAAQPIHNSMIGTERLQWVLNRTPGEYVHTDPATEQPVPVGGTNETIHPSVRMRLLKARDPKFQIDWHPVALDGFRLSETSGAKGAHGWEWVKTGKGAVGQHQTVNIPEYRIDDDSLEAKLLSPEDRVMLNDVKLSKGLKEVRAQGSWFHDHIW